MIGPESLSSAIRSNSTMLSTSFSPERSSEDNHNREREEPPRVVACSCKKGSESQTDDDASCHTPIVADDEVPPEACEGVSVTHALASAGILTIGLPRSARARRREAPPK